MLVANVIEYENIINPKYKPSLLKSYYACTDSKYMEGYKVMLDRLSKATGKHYIMGIDSCYWVWVEHPFFELHSLNTGRFYVCIYDMPEDSIVLSDYDKWSSSLNMGTIPLESCFDCSLGSNSCIQGVTWDLPWSNMVCALPLKHSFGLSLEELVKKAYLYDCKSVLEYERTYYHLRTKSELLEVAKSYCKSVLDYIDTLKIGGIKC